MPRQKKAPKPVDQLGKESKPGTLTFAGTPDPTPPTTGKKKRGFNPLFLVVFGCIALTFLIVNAMAPYKGNYNNFQRTTTTSFATLNGQIVADTRRIDNVINTMGNYASKSQLAQYAAKPELDKVANTAQLALDKANAVQQGVNDSVAQAVNNAGYTTAKQVQETTDGAITSALASYVPRSAYEVVTRQLSELQGRLQADEQSIQGVPGSILAATTGLVSMNAYNATVAELKVTQAELVKAKDDLVQARNESAQDRLRVGVLQDNVTHLQDVLKRYGLWIP